MRATGLFCEDIREEKSGALIIIGAMPDNINFPASGKSIPKIGLYIRAIFDEGEPATDIELEIRQPNGDAMAVGNFDAAAVKQAQEDSRARNIPIATVVLQALFVPFRVSEFGVFKAVIKTRSEEQVVAVMNIQPTPASAS